MVALPRWGSREIIMRKLTVTAAVAALAASLASFVIVPWNPVSPDGPLGSISPHDLTLAAPAMAAGTAPDAF
jgi:hypothetical protein